MKHLDDLIPPPQHCFWGAVMLLLALMVWPQFVSGVHLLQEGKIATGCILIAISALAGGIYVRAFQRWLQHRRTYFTTLREQPIMISDSVFNDVYDHFAHRAVEEFNECGQVPPRFFAINIDNEGAIRGVIGIPEQIAGQFYRDDGRKEAIKPLIHYLLDKQSPFRDIITEAGVPPPNLVVQICEAWTVERMAPPGGAVDVSKVIPCEQPDRQECIGVFVHSHNRTEVGFSPIRTEPTRRAEYAPLPKYAFSTGRMLMNPAPSEDPTISKH